MNLATIQHILPQFGINPAQAEINPLGNGLINHTYKITDHLRHINIVLQVVNTAVFQQPEDIQHNYLIVRNYLAQTGSTIALPRPLLTAKGEMGYTDDENRFWRGFEFIENTYSPDLADNTQLAYTAARCFGQFTHELNGSNIHLLREILPRFHDLGYRFEQFEEAIRNAVPDRKIRAEALVDGLLKKAYILSFFNSILQNPDYRIRVMHHDTKVSNILFNRDSNEVVCPVDMDTVMPGRFYSDIGDMIRTMTCSVDENSTDFNAIHIRKEYYKAILNGYLHEMAHSFTAEEMRHIHYSGLIMIYQQALRFMTDFLKGDVYYRTRYPDHNLDRARNQFCLLESLEQFLKEEYNFPIRIPAQNTVVPG